MKEKRCCLWSPVSVAPNPRRVRIFLAEKGIEVPTVQVDIGKGESRKSPYIEKNPLGGLPMLELDDGTCIAESVAICRYFEETVPEPPLFGRSTIERALVEMWNRRMEIELLLPFYANGRLGAADRARIEALDREPVRSTGAKPLAEQGCCLLIQARAHLGGEPGQAFLHRGQLIRDLGDDISLYLEAWRTIKDE